METNMPDWRPRHASSETLTWFIRKTNQRQTCLNYINYDWTPKECRSPMGHVGLQSGMAVSDQAWQSPIRHGGLR